MNENNSHQTEYRVFTEIEDGEDEIRLVDHGIHAAHNAKAAAEVALRVAEDPDPGTVVVVPAVNWHEFRGKVETQTKLTLDRV